MSTSDPIADMLTSIRNGLAVRRRYVVVPFSRLKQAVVDVLREEGYVSRFEVNRDGRFPALRVYLRYTEDKDPIVQGIQRVSRPGARVYARRNEIPWVKYGLGTVIVSTPQGVMSGRQARRMGVGGELLCEVW